jgi:hypothetical protein
MSSVIESGEGPSGSLGLRIKGHGFRASHAGAEAAQEKNAGKFALPLAIGDCGAALAC